MQLISLAIMAGAVVASPVTVTRDNAPPQFFLRVHGTKQYLQAPEGLNGTFGSITAGSFSAATAFTYEQYPSNQPAPWNDKRALYLGNGDFSVFQLTDPEEDVSTIIVHGQGYGLANQWPVAIELDGLDDGKSQGAVKEVDPQFDFHTWSLCAGGSLGAGAKDKVSPECAVKLSWVKA